MFSSCKFTNAFVWCKTTSLLGEIYQSEMGYEIIYMTPTGVCHWGVRFAACVQDRTVPDRGAQQGHIFRFL